MDIDQVFITDPVVAPDLVDQLAAGEGHGGPFGECHQQVSFRGGERHRITGEVDLLANRVHVKFPEHPPRLLTMGTGRAGAGSAQDGLNPRDELANTERFGDVVVGADGQADEGVDLILAGGDDDDVAVRESADLAAHLDAVESGQPEVEDHHVGRLITHRLHPFRSGVHDASLVPGAGQVGADHPGESLLILDDENTWSGGWVCGAHTRHSLPPFSPTRAVDAASSVARPGSSSNLNSARV